MAKELKKYGVNVIYKEDPRKEKGSHIFISNHSSRNDYIFTAIPLLPNTYNFVAGYNEFYRSHLKGIFGFLLTMIATMAVPALTLSPRFLISLLLCL